MIFTSELTEKEYKNFFKKINGDLLQSYEWGKFCFKTKGQIPYYVGLKDEKNNILCASLLLKKVLPLGIAYFYAPRGFLIDFNNYDLLDKFTEEIKIFLKSKKGIYLKVDPYISYQDVDNDAKKVIDGNNNYHLFKHLLKIGYKHQGFNKLYEKNQPRYTFIIDLKESKKDIEKRMNKSFLKNVQKSDLYALKFEVGNIDNISDFYRLFKSTAKRDNFNGYSKEYYENFYEIFNKEGMAEILTVSITPEKTIKSIEKEVARLETENKNTESQKQIDINNKKISRLCDEIIYLDQYKNSKNLIISSHIISIYNNKATALFAGSDSNFKFTFANNLMYYEKIMFAKNKECKELDLFGVTGDPHTKYKNLAGIYEFKRNLGADLVEFIGEFDLITKPILYPIIKVLLPLYRKIRKIFHKKVDKVDNI